jgi:hypothetical protein
MEALGKWKTSARFRRDSWVSKCAAVVGLEYLGFPVTNWAPFKHDDHLSRPVLNSLGLPLTYSLNKQVKLFLP